MVNVYNTLSTPYSYNLLKKKHAHTLPKPSVFWVDTVSEKYYDMIR